MTETPYTPIDCDFHDELEAASTLRRTVELVVVEDDGSKSTIRDVIVDLANEFMWLGSGKRYRFDRIVSIDGKIRPL